MTCQLLFVFRTLEHNGKKSEKRRSYNDDEDHHAVVGHRSGEKN